jgi:AcrR family transcriptional regulator
MNSLGIKQPAQRPAKRAAARPGRPSKEQAGEVEARVLDAARDVFLARGFEGATIDEIAERARSGKQTIYARFRNKSELFTAVVTRDLAGRITKFGGLSLSGETTEQRFIEIAKTVLHWSLNEQRIDLMRLAIAEVQRFPELASSVSLEAQSLSTQVAARLFSELAKSDRLDGLVAFTPERMSTTARLFLDLVVVPFILRALFQRKLDDLRSEIDQHAERTVKFFLAACENLSS